MSADNGVVPRDRLESNQEFDLKEFIVRYLRYLPWVILSIAICLAVAYVKLRYEVPIYSVYGKMLMKTAAAVSNNSEGRFNDLFVGQSTQNLIDQIEQIRSTSISKRVVNKLNLQISYYNEGSIRSTLLHHNETPIRLEVVQLADSLIGYSFQLVHVSNSEYRFKDSTKTHFYGEIIEQNRSKFRIVLTGETFVNLTSKEFTITWQPLKNTAKALGSNLNVVQANDYSYVLDFRYEIENPKVGADIVDAFMQSYKEFGLEEKKEIAFNTLRFIDEQLDTFRNELGGVEQNLQHYRERNRVIDVPQQSTIYLGNENQIQQQIIGLEVQRKISDYLTDYIGREQNAYKIVPSTLGINEPALSQTIGSYNQLQLQRETTLRTTPENNPLIRDLDVAIAKLRSDMLANINNVRRGYDVALTDLQRKTQATESLIGTIPGKQKQLLEITRQQQILQELYSFLGQKKLETSISSASSVSNTRILEPADYSNVPIRPNKKATYVIAFLVGLAVPVSIIGARELLNDKIRKRSDVEKITDTPILGEIGHSEGQSSLIVTSNNRSYIAEQFRIVRSNLQYLIPKKQITAKPAAPLSGTGKTGLLTVTPSPGLGTPITTSLQKSGTPVIMITSSFSGEGKSFISTNLAAVLALSGKKTVILELDIRKPKILRGLGMSETSGFTKFIVGSQEKEDLALPVKGTDNLYVIPCGPLPPNPSELLLDEKVPELFNYLKEQFEAIVVDTAPVGLVGDALTLGNYADTCIYIIRHNYTYKKQIKLIDSLHREEKLPKMAIVINDIKGGGTYGSYSGYGYGYGYGGKGKGNGSGYFEDDKKKRKKKAD